MTISELVKMCVNITPDTDIFIYLSTADFDSLSKNCIKCKSVNLYKKDLKILKFIVYKNFVAIVIA